MYNVSHVTYPVGKKNDGPPPPPQKNPQITNKRVTAPILKSIDDQKPDMFGFFWPLKHYYLKIYTK